jgi:Flp pilus assembly protein TadG
MNSLVRIRRSRAKRTRGAEILEFTLVFAPMMAMVLVLLDIGWVIFAKSTLQYAVRSGVRAGVTITGTQATAAGSDLTTMVKNIVQQKSLGLLRGTSGLSKIKVHYYQPPAPGSTGPAVDVSNQPNGNTPLYIMQVSVEGYSLAPLVARLYSFKDVDTSPTTITAIAADLIEPSRDVPPIGVAP